MTDLVGVGMTSPRTRLRMVERLRGRGIRDAQVLAAMEAVPRHVFVEPALASRAYEDTALPLGFGQTISQPFVVARMLEAMLAGEVAGKVLEVGTGCGYQTAVLARLAREVYSVERVAGLLDRARRNLRALKLGNVRLKHGDGMQGLPEAAPYNAIVVCAAPPEVPLALLEQLAVGGRMVIPVGDGNQQLVVYDNTPRGLIQTRLDFVRFVPLLPGLA